MEKDHSSAGKPAMIVSLFLATALTAGCAPAPQPAAPSPVNLPPAAVKPDPKPNGIATMPPAETCQDENRDNRCDDDGIDIDRSGGTYIYNGMTYYRRGSGSSGSTARQPVTTTLPPGSSGAGSGGTAPNSAHTKPDAAPTTSSRTGSFTQNGGSSSSSGSGISSGTSSHGGIGSSGTSSSS